jgi:transcriptional regulator with XRE-family HTH domain
MSTTLSVRLRELRQERGLTQMQLATRASVRQSTLSDWELGKVERVSASTLERVCSVLGIYWMDFVRPLLAPKEPTVAELQAFTARLLVVCEVDRAINAAIASAAAAVEQARACQARCAVDTDAWRAASASVDAATAASAAVLDVQRVLLRLNEAVCREWDEYRAQFTAEATHVN